MHLSQLLDEYIKLLSMSKREDVVASPTFTGIAVPSIGSRLLHP